MVPPANALFLAVGPVLVATLAVVWPASDPDRFSLRAPHLHPVLVVERVANELVRFRIDVENNGNLPATLTFHALGVPGQWRTAKGSSNSEMAVPPSGVVSLRDAVTGARYRDRILVDLVLVVRANADGQSRVSRSFHRFVAFAHNVSVGSMLHPVESSAPIEFDRATAWAEEHERTLTGLDSQDQGTLAFRFRDSEGLKIRTPRRQIRFDEESRRVLFRIQPTTETVHLLTLPISDSVDEHSVLVPLVQQSGVPRCRWTLPRGRLTQPQANTSTRDLLRITGGVALPYSRASA